ncbi:DNA-binding protein rfx6, partial [Tyrophagus putrescentiae]
SHSNSPLNSSNSSNNSQQSHCTFKWLETNFQFRSHVSISRSTIYELYQKFCSQNGFIAVCKATFGKIIRIKFPKVKSKRLGARGQSKYHYYNITFRDERKRCSMLLSGSNSSETSTVENQASNPSSKHHPQLSSSSFKAHHQPLFLLGVINHLAHHHLTTINSFHNRQTTHHPHHPHHPQQITTSESPLINHHHHHRRLTIFSNRHSALESYSHFNLNENDYHAIIQSMLSYMRLPRAEESGAVPLSNDRFVFVNLYKIHCQCLLDSALAANLAQMRHYVMHFWQQLPRSVPVYARSMAALDAHMYALLEDIYAGSVEAPVEGLRRLNTVAHLLPVWLKRTFQVVVPNSIAGGGQNLWALLEPEDNVLKGMNIDSRRRVSVGELKVEEATRWSVRIQFKVDFILGVKKINFEQLPGVLQRLLAVFDSVYEPVDTSFSSSSSSSSSSFNLENNCPESFRFPQPQQYVHSTRPSGHLFHQTASLLWHTLLREFREMLERLLKVNTSSSSNESTSAEEAVRTLRTEDRGEEAAEQPKLSGQLLVDELDRLIQAVQGQMEALQSSSSGGQTPSSSSSSWTTANHHRLFSNLTLLFGRLVDDLLGWMAVERTLQRMDGQLVDEFVEEEEEEEEEEENFEDDLENDDEGEAEAITSAQLTSSSPRCTATWWRSVRRCSAGADLATSRRMHLEKVD